jgi:hypothetical protein
VAYATTCQVYAHCYSLVKPASAFDTSTCPSLSEVEQWLTTGCAVINTYLAGKGYGVPTSGTALHEMLGQANALWAAALAEDSRVSARISADERTRGDRFYRQYEKLMAMVDRMDLSRAGLSQTSVAYAGGISRSDKDSVASNTDRVPSRFRRGQFRNPEAGNDLDSAS